MARSTFARAVAAASSCIRDFGWRGWGLAASVLLAACVARKPERDWFRAPGPRAEATIFTALPWPTPNDVRNGAGAPGADYWQQQVDYEIVADFDPASRTIDARAHVRYSNRSPDALDYLWLQLDANVFRPGSLGDRVGERTAIAMRDASGEGLQLGSVRGPSGELAVHAYDTLARVDLPTAIPPRGGTLELDLDWTFVIPEEVFRRFGIEKALHGEIFEAAQWFPALAVYDDVHGWNTLPYLGTGEFYTNFGDYDVRLSVPWDQLVVATGTLENPTEVYTSTQVERLSRARTSDETIVIRSAEEVGDPASRPAREGRLTWHFRAHDVRTFAWACSPAFVLDAANADGVLCQSAYPEEGLPVWGKSTQMLRSAILGYGRRWHRYPYPVATNVSGKEPGMEYPMIVFCRADQDEHDLFGVTAHEIGHNWFPMLVNTDERRHAWMDEGFNTFINTYADEDWFGVPGDGRGNPARFAHRMLASDLVPIETPPDRLPPRLLGELEYSKTAAGLILLREQVLGPERFDHAFRKYIERWAFKSPRPADFFRTMEDAAGVDLAWFWRGWFYETSWLDQAVAEIVQPAAGRPGTIAFENRGELVMPLTYRVLWKDGEQQDFQLPVEVWFHSDRIVERVPGDRHIAHVVVDPSESLPDVDRTNNQL